MKKPKLTLPLILALIGVALFIVAVAYAVVTWTQTINWTMKKESFSVDQPTTLDYGIVDVGTVKTETYTVTNDGNVPITVTASAQPSTLTAGTAFWNQTSQKQISATIPVGESVTFTLELTITGAGSCTVTISS